jgi:lipopolysaccharide export system protein LptA
VHGTSDGAASPVQVVSRTPGQPERVTSSHRLDAQFAAGTTSIASIEQSGEFHYSEGTRTANADQARFTTANNLLTLSGNPRYGDDQVQLSSDSLALNRASGEIRAAGNVKSTYLPQKDRQQNPGGAMFSAAAAVHVTARDLVAQRSAGTATFSGGARLWQGADLVEAPTIQFNRDRRGVDARGSASQPVHSVFVQAGQNGRTVPVNVASARLTYTGLDNQAHFTGGVTVQSTDATLKADHIDVILRQQAGGRQLSGQTGQTSESGSSGPAQVERIIAQGNVTMVQPGRRATGQRLVYVAADQSFTLTGGPPSIFDAERGQISGDSLTFYTHDGRVLIGSGQTSQSLTPTRIRDASTK